MHQITKIQELSTQRKLVFRECTLNPSIWWEDNDPVFGDLKSTTVYMLLGIFHLRLNARGFPGALDLNSASEEFVPE